MEPLWPRPRLALVDVDLLMVSLIVGFFILSAALVAWLDRI
jgi:hypothetical protein